MPRRYQMKARADAAEATRQRVLEAARATILEGPSPTFSMGDVARRAGVARSTLYATYGSHAGLIGAVLVDAQIRSGFERILELHNLPDAEEGLRRALPEAAQMFGEDYDLLRRISLLAELDPQVKAALTIATESRARGMRYQAERLSAQGRLRSGTSLDEAAMIMWLLTEFCTYEALRSTWELSSDQIGDFLVEIAARCLFGD